MVESVTGLDDPADVMARLVPSGALVLRRQGGYSAEEFAALGDGLMVARHHGGVIPDGRELVDETTTTVTAGSDGIALHREASYAPFSPALVMFHCVRPASSGGQTTICDGVKLLEALPASVRAFVTDAEIRWEIDLPDGTWQARFGTDDPDVAIASVRRWTGLLSPWESISAGFRGSTMTSVFGTRCVTPAVFDRAPTFCNSVLTRTSGRDDGLRLLLADGTPFPAEILRQTAAYAAELTEEVQWSAGDIVVVDNTRVMHGRRAFADPARRIHVRMGYLTDESLARWGG